MCALLTTRKKAFKDSKHMEMIFLALWGPNCRTKPTHAHLVFHGALTGQWEADSVSKGQRASFKPPVLLVSGAVLVLSRLLVCSRETLKPHTQTLQGSGLCHIRAAVVISIYREYEDALWLFYCQTWTILKAAEVDACHTKGLHQRSSFFRRSETKRALWLS